jgi:hypothetical protein
MQYTKGECSNGILTWRITSYHIVWCPFSWFIFLCFFSDAMFAKSTHDGNISTTSVSVLNSHNVL